MSGLKTEGDVIGDLVRYEHPSALCRELGTILSGAGVLEIGSVLGKQTKSVVEAEADGDNTGNGTVGAVTLGAKAEVGVYTLTCTAAASNAGTFSVETPSGNALPDLTVGAAYTSGHINLTIADGATDFAEGDVVTITVSGSDKFDLYVPGEVDGLGEVAGILLANIDATSADVEKVLILTSDAVVSRHGLKYDAAVDSEDERAAVEKALKVLGIKLAEGA